ncbi:hypothetical protein ACFX1Q_030029 [Malus domestica]
MLVQTRSFGSCSFRLVRTKSIWCRVAVSARAGNEHLVPCCSFSSCRQGAFGAVLQFQLVQARSVGLSHFMLVQTRSIWCRVAVSARAGNERWVVAFYDRADRER